MAALPPAGVDLQARGFRDYIRKLDQIDKQQQEVFGRQGKGLETSFDRAEKSAREYENQIKKTAKAQDALAKSLQGLAVGIFSQQTAEAAFEAARAANAFNAQRQSLVNLAAQYGQSGNAILAAVRRGADGTVSANDAILASNAALQLGVAETPEQLEEIARIATTLATAAGQDASQGLQEFITALGRGSVQILDNFNVSSQAVNAELERLAQQRFGVTVSELDEAAKQTLFLEAALRVAGEQADTISANLDDTVGSFDRLAAETENLQIAFGAALGGSGLIGLLTDAAVTAQQLLALISAGVAGTGNLLSQLGGKFQELRAVIAEDRGFNLQDVLLGPLGRGVEAVREGTVDLSLDLIEAGEAAEDAFLNVAAVLGVGTEEPIKTTTRAIEEQTGALEDNEAQIEALQGAVRQAEQLQLSFARAAEDAARKLERSQRKLGERQAKERDKLLKDQQKELDEFEADRLETIADAEADIAKESKKAGRDRLREQQNLQRQLRQAEERFNLDRVQSRRRFLVEDRRLRAEGDILALQELRENFELEKQEASENFGLQQRQTKENAGAQQKEREQDNRERARELEERLADLKVNLEDQRAELLTGFDEQFNALRQSQAEQRQELIRSYNEQQEDARINQQRQIEDLGRSLAVQQDVTAEGVTAIAGEIEKVFGQEGVADTIFGGFTERTESQFQGLFENIESLVARTSPSLSVQRSRFGGGITPFEEFGIPSFDDGGVVPGPTGSPQIIRAHGGETVLPTHRMSLPAIPTQRLEVSGGATMNVNAQGASQGIIDAAVMEMTENFDIALKRMVRRNNG